MEAFLSVLRNLAVHNTEGQYFSTVVAAFQRLDKLGPELPRGGSPWYNHYLYVDLKPFSQEDIDNYFFNPDGHFFISIPDNIQKEKVLEMTGGYPILLQRAGYIFSQSDRDIDINTFKAEFKNQTEYIFILVWVLIDNAFLLQGSQFKLICLKIFIYTINRITLSTNFSIEVINDNEL